MNLRSETKVNKYKIRVASISPDISEQALFAKKKCVLGVSMSNPVFWRSSLNSLLHWISNNFDECLIVVGDYLHRLNEQILEGDQETAATQRALETGDRFLERLNEYLPLYPSDKFQVFRWESLYKDADFPKSQYLIQEVYQQYPDFQSSIKNTANFFTERKFTQTQSIQVSEEEAITLSSQYLLEEMAVFNMLIQRDWEVVLYPGEQLPLLVEIGKGHYPQVPKPLQKGIYVELKVIKKG